MNTTDRNAQSRVLFAVVTEGGISVRAITVTGVDVAVGVVGSAGTDVATGTTSGVTGGSAPGPCSPVRRNPGYGIGILRKVKRS